MKVRVSRASSSIRSFLSRLFSGRNPSKQTLREGNPDAESAVIAAQDYENIYVVDCESVAIGGGILVERALQGIPHDPEEAVRRQLENYAAHYLDTTGLYPGVPEGLKRLKDAGWLVALVTNKPENAAEFLLNTCGCCPAENTASEPMSAPKDSLPGSVPLLSITTAGKAIFAPANCRPIPKDNG